MSATAISNKNIAQLLGANILSKLQADRHQLSYVKAWKAVTATAKAVFRPITCMRPIYGPETGRAWRLINRASAPSSKSGSSEDREKASPDYRTRQPPPPSIAAPRAPAVHSADPRHSLRMRRGEITAVRWRVIDLNNAQLAV